MIAKHLPTFSSLRRNQVHWSKLHPPPLRWAALSWSEKSHLSVSLEAASVESCSLAKRSDAQIQLFRVTGNWTVKCLEGDFKGGKNKNYKIRLRFFLSLKFVKSLNQPSLYIIKTMKFASFFVLKAADFKIGLQIYQNEPPLMLLNAIMMQKKCRLRLTTSTWL